MLLIYHIHIENGKSIKNLEIKQFLRSLIGCLDEFNAKTDILMERFRTLADGRTKINLFDEINNLTLDIITSVIHKTYFIFRYELYF